MPRSSKSSETLTDKSVRDRYEETIQLLRDLGLPKGQQNVRSARVLLAYLNLGPDTPWAQAAGPLRGIHDVMEWIDEHYGFRYKENTRESLRRKSVHQMLQGGVLLKNPDDPERPVNSDKTVYSVAPRVLELVRSYGTSSWDQELARYLADAPTLAAMYAQQRETVEITLDLSKEVSVALSAGGQSPLIRQVVVSFVPQFVRQPRVLYLGDAKAKSGHWDHTALADLGLTFDKHGPMPDVIVHDGERNWLILIEAVTSHGPVDPKRVIELKALFSASRAGLVFVTAFPDRKTFRKYLADIAWETEVWIAEDATHMIHFNGERFLGPYS